MNTTVMFESAIKIIKTLKDNGFKALICGGFVRDHILGNNIKDIDIVTDAMPDDVVSIFPKTVPVGISFGIVVVIQDDFEFEIATFRTDGRTLDGRRPKDVNFSSVSIEEDAKRRDLTINGLFFDPLTNEILDFVNGKEDIKNKVIRLIGNPVERITEDFLRLLRVVRFCAKLEFEIEEKTMRAVKLHAHNISCVSVERIKQELDKMLLLEKPSIAIKLLVETKLLEFILPEINELRFTAQNPKFHKEGSVFIHTLIALDHARELTDDLSTLWGILLHDIGKPEVFELNEEGNITAHGHDKVGADMARKVMNRFKASNEETGKVVFLVENHMKLRNIDKMKKSTLRKLITKEHFDSLFTVCTADCFSAKPSDPELEKNKFKDLDLILKKIVEFENEPVLPKPLLNGRDLIDLGFKPSPLFKKILAIVFDKQLEDEIRCRASAKRLVIELMEKEIGNG